MIIAWRKVCVRVCVFAASGMSRFPRRWRCFSVLPCNHPRGTGDRETRAHIDGAGARMRAGRRANGLRSNISRTGVGRAGVGAGMQALSHPRVSNVASTAPQAFSAAASCTRAPMRSGGGGGGQCDAMATGQPFGWMDGWMGLRGRAKRARARARSAGRGLMNRLRMGERSVRRDRAWAAERGGRLARPETGWFWF